MREKVLKYITENLQKTIRYNPEDKGNLIGLPRPYNVPSVSEKFQEMYYWDTYFLNRGLILLGNVEQAKNNTENMFFLIDKYGFMPNGNRTFYLHNSQPPFLSLMVDDIYSSTGDKEWLAYAYKILEKEYAFWQNERNTEIGLNQYTGNKKMAMDEKMFEGFLRRIGNRPEGHTDEHLSCQYVAACESGWDISPRFGFYVENFVNVELNALLYALEKNMSKFSRELGISADNWDERAADRLEKMNKYMLKDDIYYDYDFKNGIISDKFTCASYYPMMLGMIDDDRAKALADNLKRIETDYGVAVTEKMYDADKYTYQWQYPNGWSPLFDIVFRGLYRYGYKAKSKEIAQKYVDLIENNFRKTGNLWEKYNVVSGGIDVKYESSNGVCDMPPMIGWTAGVYIEALKIIEQ
ncbi:MAG: alpha,alpha-trehalase [Clostridia bacterium]|nr:alpha,alpha-trehalase [Clostridia bacterium]